MSGWPSDAAARDTQSEATLMGLLLKGGDVLDPGARVAPAVTARVAAPCIVVGTLTDRDRPD